MQNECTHCYSKRMNNLGILSHNMSCPCSPIDVWIAHFVKHLDIRGYDTLLNVVRNTKIRTPADIYSLSNIDIGAANPTLVAKAITIIMESIEDSRSRDLGCILHALDPDVFPISAIQPLENTFPSIWDMAEADTPTLTQAVSALREGKDIAEGIKKFFDRPEIIEMLIELDAAGLHLEAFWAHKTPKGLTSNPFRDKNIVFTGVLSSMTRHDAHRAVESRGGYPQSSLTKSTDIMVVGSKPGNTKLHKARQYGTPTLSEIEFLQLIRDTELSYK